MTSRERTSGSEVIRGEIDSSASRIKAYLVGYVTSELPTLPSYVIPEDEGYAAIRYLNPDDSLTPVGQGVIVAWGEHWDEPEHVLLRQDGMYVKYSHKEQEEPATSGDYIRYGEQSIEAINFAKTILGN